MSGKLSVQRRAHRYRIECERCAQLGTLRVSVDPQNAAPRPDAVGRGG